MKHSPAIWMWAEACAMLDQAERLRRQFFHPGPPRNVKPIWEAPIDICETTDEWYVVVAMPGVREGDLLVEIEGNILTVMGERDVPMTGAARIRRLEIPFGRFERAIELPPGGLELRHQHLSEGCLAITLGKVR